MRRDILLALLTVCLVAVGVRAFDDIAPADQFPSIAPQVSPYKPDPVDAVVSQSRRSSATRVGTVRARVFDSSTDERLQRIEEAIDRLESQVEALQRSIPTPHALLVPTRRNEPGFRGLYMMNRDGSDPQFIVAAPGMISTSDVAWSHNGRFLAMNALPQIDAFGESRIFIHTLEGSDAGAIRDMGYGGTPDWSPDDRQIAYMLNAANPDREPGGLWVMDADGGNRRRLGDAWWPRWSPDGNRICAHGWKADGNATLFMFDPVSGARRDPLDGSGWSIISWGCSWSSDGQRLAFVGTFEGQQHLATIDAGGDHDSIRILYTGESGHKLFGPPTWSPDGRQLVFGMQDANSSSRWFMQSYLYSMAADIPSAPVLLEKKKTDTINRVAAFSPDSSKIIFSSER